MKIPSSLYTKAGRFCPRGTPKAKRWVYVTQSDGPTNWPEWKCNSKNLSDVNNRLYREALRRIKATGKFVLTAREQVGA